MTKYKQVLTRFFSVFLAGGVSSALILFTTGVQLTNADELKKFGTTLLVSFAVGGIAAVDKALFPTPSTTQTIIQNVPAGAQSTPGTTILTSTTDIPSNVTTTDILPVTKE